MDTLQAEDDVILTSITPVTENNANDNTDWPWISKYHL